MKQAVLTSPETITFSEIDKPVIKPNEILMKVKNIGICGSDIHAMENIHLCHSRFVWDMKWQVK